MPRDAAAIDPARASGPKAAVVYRMVMPGHACPYGTESVDPLRRRGFEVDDRHLETRDRTDPGCACAGGDAKVPLGSVGLTENVMMAGMAVVMGWLALAWGRRAALSRRARAGAGAGAGARRHARRGPTPYQPAVPDRRGSNPMRQGSPSSGRVGPSAQKIACTP